MSPRRRNDRDNSPWSSKRSRSRSYSPGRRYRRSPRNNNRKRSRSRDKYVKREQSSNNYRSDYMSSKGISSARIPAPPPPSVHSISASVYNTAPESEYKNYGGYNQYSTMQTDYSQTAMPPQFNMAYPPPPSWSTTAPEPHVMAAPPPWPVAPPMAAPIHQIQPIQPPQVAKENVSDTASREAAVAQEIQNQREELKKQRNDYLRKHDTMKKELKMLKEQMIDLVGPGDAPPSPTTKGYIDENDKLQGQIQNKINTIENVLDMLNGIIGDDEKKEPTPEKAKIESSDSSASSSSSSTSSDSDDSSPERLKTKVIESMKSRKESQKLEEKKKEKRENNNVSDAKCNFIFYDPEMNWCQVCNVFPKSAKDYLNHLHSKEHSDKVETPPTPWHEDFRSDEFPHIGQAPPKRVPIRGLQFFVPSRAWFCKLCKVWMGDLHCASSHLKSRTHSNKYDEFFQKNLTYEVEWMAQRQKALGHKSRFGPPVSNKLEENENVFDNIPLKLGALKNSEEKPSKSKKNDSKKDKKKKKRSKKHKKGSSSSTSNSSSSESEAAATKEDRATSIRVAMRNIKKTDEEMKDDLTSKGGYNPMEADEIERKKDEMIMTQWNTPQPIISESEKKLLEQLKGKLKNKSQDEIAKKESEPKRSSGRDHIRKRSPASKDRSPIIRKPNRERFRNRTDRRSRSINRYNRRTRSRDRERRSRSRRRNNSPGRTPYHWRTNRRSTSRDRRRWSISKSRSRSRSRSSSASRRSSRVEKPSVRYPEFRPRISENESKRRSERERKLAGNPEEENDRKKSPVSTTTTKKSSTTTSSYAGGKKLPFIGRMPVLAKKQQEQNNENNSTESAEDTANALDQMRDTKSMEGGYTRYDDEGVYYDDLMPDPMAYASLMGAPPPPPPPMHVTVDEKEILPPGIDEMETEFVPKPMSEVPAPRKGPLPKDFEEALNIIFPDENKIEENKINLPLEAKIPFQIHEIQAAPIPQQHHHLTDNLNNSDIVLPNIDASKNIEPLIFHNTQQHAMPMPIELQHIEMPPPIEITIDTNNIIDTTAAAVENISTPGTVENNNDDEIDISLMQLENNITKEISNPESLQKQQQQTIVKSTTDLDDIQFELSSQNNNMVGISAEDQQQKNFTEDTNHITQIIESYEITAIREPSPIPVPNPKHKEWQPEELDDLAMLGIDADDLAAQCM